MECMPITPVLAQAAEGSNKQQADAAIKALSLKEFSLPDAAQVGGRSKP